KNYLKGRRKFEELISSQPESEYLLEAKLWIGKCNMRLKNYSDALVILVEVRKEAVEEGEDEILQEAFIEEIVYRKTIKDFPGAIQSATEFLEASDNDEIKAEVWYEVGNLNLEIENISEAVVAYKNVFEYSPDFDLEVSANLKLGRALREIGEAEEALLLFEDMKSEDKYAEKYADIELEIGKTQSVLGNYNEAIEQLTYVDTTYKNTPSSGAAKFELAYIYETGFVQFDSAAVYYKKASASTLPPEYIDGAKEKNRLFTRYVILSNHHSKYGKQLFYFTYPEEFAKDSMKYVQDSLLIAQEIANVQELQAIWSGLDSLLTVGKDTTGYYKDSVTVADILVTIHQDSIENFNRDTVLARVRNPQIQDSTLIEQFDSMLTNRTFDPAGKDKLEQ
ncbi:MAG: tetratricopeptide repeat protein, partial [Ignavibacteriales bacterium]